MGIVARPYRAVVFLMVLTLGVFLGLSAEDVVDAVYDESETQPLEGTSLFLGAALRPLARTPQPMLRSSTSSCLGSLTRPNERRAERSAHTISRSLTIIDHSLRC